MNVPAQDRAAAARAAPQGLRSRPAEPVREPRPRIILDALGGEAPLRERLTGAANAARLYSDIDLVLCGARDEMERELDELGDRPGNVECVNAPEPIGMHEPPVRALREKKNSSIVVGLEMVARDEADAFVSAGNTGAVAAASTLKLGRLEGVQRPGIAATMKVIDNTVVAIDVGANVDSRPTHLLQYGIMATVFCRKVLDIANPRVGLLNVGEERAKGNDLVKQSHELLADADINFIGNAEPTKLFNGECDIIVCDGFVGNILLKLGESLTLKVIGWLRDQVGQSLRYKLGFALCRDLFSHLKLCADYSEYGGAPLLGINGITIITHGTSDARAIQNAIREARLFVKYHVNDHIEDAVRTDAVSRGLRA